jgi:voltage-gated potassium channel
MYYSPMDRFWKTLIWYSVATYFCEILMGAADSLHGHPFFLWSERVVAGLFTYEVFHRLRKVGYANSARFWVDLVAIIPFYFGFFVPVEWLGWIRTLRVLRLLKLYWYYEGIRDLLRAFIRAQKALKGALICMTVVVLFSSALLFQAEGPAQPEKFGHIGNCIYYCLTAAVTVGFGDLYTVTPLGKLITIFFLYGPAILVAGSVIGIVGAAYQEELHKDEKKD